MWDEIIPSDVSLKETHVIYVLLGGLIALFGLFSLIIKDKFYMSEALVATVFGVLIGPQVSKVFDPLTQFEGGKEQLDKITLEVARLVLAIQCLTAGISSPGNYVLKEIKSMAMLLGPVMLVMWVTSALGIWLIMGVPWLMALLMAACVTPTDPVLANSIVKGKFAETHIPINVRLLLSAESAANDGLGVPLLILPVYLMRITNGGEAVGWWLLKIVIYQIGLAITLGVVIGVLARKALKNSEYKGWIDKESMLGFSIALALITTGSLALLGVDDVLGCYVVGTVLSWDQWFNRQIKESHIQEVIDALINLTFFVFFGTRVPWLLYGSSDSLAIWRLITVSIWILVLRRLPIVLALSKLIPALKNTKEAFFCGWFGPIGAGAVFYSMIAVTVLEVEDTDIFPIVTFIVLSSIVLHGGTVSLFELGLNTHSTWRSDRIARQQVNAAAAPAPGELQLPIQRNSTIDSADVSVSVVDCNIETNHVVDHQDNVDVDRDS